MSKATYEEMRSLVQSAMNGEWDREKLKEKKEEKDAKEAGNMNKNLIAEAVTFLGREI